MKNHVKLLNRDGQAFPYLHQKFPRLSKTKIREDIFVKPNVRDILKDGHFDSTSTDI